MNYRMKIQYDGTRYKGWQRQAGANDGSTSMTIQGKIESVLTKFTGRFIRIDGAGRTDAGVHAMEQTANVRIEEDLCAGAEELKEYLNQYLPEDIRILDAQPAGERFHSRLNATGKRYCYHITKYDRDCVFSRKYAWKVSVPLDVDKMNKASEYFLGTHDFRSFCSRPSKKKSTARTIKEIRIEETDQEIVLTFEGNGFLYNMVRILTGTLVEVGAGKREPEDMQEILEKMERKYAGETAPAKGLFLVKVFYD